MGTSIALMLAIRDLIYPWLLEADEYSFDDVRDGVRMHLNESPYPPPRHILEAVIQNLQYTNRYQHPDLFNRFAELAAEYSGVEPGNVLPTPGGDGALRTIFYNLAQPGDKIVMYYPSYSMYRVYASVRGLRQVRVGLVEGDEWWYVDRERLLNEVRDARLVVIDNPNNPTGSAVLDRELAEEIASSVRGFLVIDEAYYEFYGKSLAQLVYEYPNVLVIRTLSKAFSLASLRVGYLIGSEDVVRVLRKTTTPFDISLPGLIAGIKALEDPSYVKDVVSEVITNREYLRNGLRRLGLKVFNSHTNFLLIRDGRDLLTPLMGRSIAIRNPVPGYYRITVGTREQCELLLRTLGDALEDRNTE